MRQDSLSIFWAGLPYVATGVGLYLFDQALVAVGVYHVGIAGLWLSRRFDSYLVIRGLRGRWVLGFGFLCALTAPLVFLLWPVMVRDGVELGNLLSRWHLGGLTVVGFALYAITVHPVLEEALWRGMLPDRMRSDLLFAGFHLLVLAPLVHTVWLPVVFGVLATASWIWRWMARRFGGLAVPVLTHAVADLGVVLAVWGLMR